MRTRRACLAITAVTVTVTLAIGGIYAYSDSSADPAKPESSDKADTKPPTKDHNCGEAGEYQESVEASLASLADYGTVFVDGEQSKADCEAIERFQKRMGIKPANGDADEVTGRVAENLTRAAFGDCEAATQGRTVCVDMTHQTLWVVEDGERIFEPTVVRTGMKGYASTPGTFTINHRADTHWSEPFEEWLPFWQHYYAGEGLHEATTYIHDPSGGSHGCVNLLRDDAEELYGLLDYGDTIEVFGHRPGT